MLNVTEDLLMKSYNFKKETFDLYKKVLEDVQDNFKMYDEIREYNQLKVLRAFQEERISDTHFTNSSGYGMNDIGRDTLDKVYAKVFNAEAALVRPHFVSGTHAIGCAISGNLRPGNTLLAISGAPYDTLHNVIGINGKENIGSLKEYGVNYKEIDLTEEGNFKLDDIRETLQSDSTITMVHIQRSTGYGWRNALYVEQIGEAIKVVKSVRENIIVFVDNCYGEFTDVIEPTDVGADLMAGSLIKNIGGGISLCGGYVVGKEKYVEQAAYKLTVPGIGAELGATFGLMRQFFQGLFLAPNVTIEAVKGAVFCAKLFELAGYTVLPTSNTKRSDIIQAIKFEDKDKVIKFCKGIQYGSPVDSFVQCEPSYMPGYNDAVIMAAGGFNQGASVELSADAPIRPPYIAYMQGGLTFDHAKIGVLIGFNNTLTD